MAINSKDIDKQTYGEGFQVQTSDLDEIQQNPQAAIRRMQLNFVGVGASGAKPAATLDSPASGNIFLGSADFIDPTGKAFGWNNSQTVDMLSATAGASQGSTAPSASGNLRYIVAAAKYLLVESDDRTDASGNPYKFRQEAGFQIDTYQTADISSPDVIEDNTTLTALLATIKSDGYVPIAVAKRDFGSIVVDQIWNVTQAVWESATPQADRVDVRNMQAYHGLPIVANASGTVANTSSAVPASGGQVDITGGEVIHMNWIDHADGDTLKRIKVTLPAATLQVENTSSEYVIRMYVNRDGTPVLYRGEGIYPEDAYFGDLSRGTDGGSNQGSAATLIDIPLLKVVTGSANTIPTVTQIVNDARSALLVANSTLDGAERVGAKLSGSLGAGTVRSQLDLLGSNKADLGGVNTWPNTQTFDGAIVVNGVSQHNAGIDVSGSPIRLDGPIQRTIPGLNFDQEDFYILNTNLTAAATIDLNAYTPSDNTRGSMEFKVMCRDNDGTLDKVRMNKFIVVYERSGSTVTIDTMEETPSGAAINTPHCTDIQVNTSGSTIRVRLVSGGSINLDCIIWGSRTEWT